jgi:AcrR family transcriptional regulator
VSRNAFYALFTDKTDCFIALCDELAADLLDYYTSLEGDDWVDLLRRGAAHYLRWWSERPAFARTYFVELPAAGPRAMEQRDRQYASFLTVFEELARLARPDGDLPKLVPRLLVVSITELVAEEVRAGRTEQLTALEDQLVEVMVRLLTV